MLRQRNPCPELLWSCCELCPSHGDGSPARSSPCRRQLGMGPRPRLVVPGTRRFLKNPSNPSFPPLPACFPVSHEVPTLADLCDPDLSLGKGFFNQGMVTSQSLEHLGNVLNRKDILPPTFRFLEQPALRVTFNNENFLLPSAAISCQNAWRANNFGSQAHGIASPLSSMAVLCKDTSPTRNVSAGDGGFRWMGLVHCSRHRARSRWLRMQHEGHCPPFPCFFVCSDTWEALEELL